MKKKYSLPGFFITMFIFGFIQCFSQKNKYISIDSALKAGSEPWKVKENKSLFGFGKPAFGPFVTTQAAKLDSPVIKRKTREGIEFGGEISSAGHDFDISKTKIFEKTKFYRLLVAKEADTAEVVFSVYSVSKEKSQTILGKVISKNDEGKDAVLSYNRKVSGMIVRASDSIPWQFFVDDYLSDRKTTEDNSWGDKEKAPDITGGYLKNHNDSLFTEPIMRTLGTPKDKFFLSWQTGLSLKNNKGEHLAALQFDGMSQFYIWLRKDLDDSYQEAVASLFAVIISIKGL